MTICLSSQIVASESITQAYLLPTKSDETISEELVKSAIDEINDEKISNSEILIELARYITKREK